MTNEAADMQIYRQFLTARALTERLLTAHVTGENANPIGVGYYTQRAHEELAELAERMGYRIVPLVESEEAA